LRLIENHNKNLSIGDSTWNFTILNSSWQLCNGRFYKVPYWDLNDQVLEGVGRSFFLRVLAHNHTSFHLSVQYRSFMKEMIFWILWSASMPLSLFLSPWHVTRS
jgi:hypothetical protein